MSKMSPKISIFVDGQKEPCDEWFRRSALISEELRRALGKEELRTVILADAFAAYTHHNDDHLKGLSTLEVWHVAHHGDQQLAQDAQPERAVVLEEVPQRGELPPPLWNNVRNLLQAHCSALYAQVLEETLADLRLEHSATLTDGRPWKARYILLQGCGALAAATIRQLGYSLLGRIASLWQAKSPK